MSERLNNLIRQKELTSQHLNWLEQEIAAENGENRIYPLASKKNRLQQKPSAPVAAPKESSKEESKVAAKTIEEGDPEVNRLSDQIIMQYGQQIVR
tara:strand:- start:849 stop:1136 length:288 start_codon:yes stop_codon:yes gene_type:complete